MTDAAQSVTIRPANRQDMTAVAAMAGEFYAFLAAMDDSDPAFDVEETEAKLARSAFGAKPQFSSLIAEADGEPVGYAIYNIGCWTDTMQGMVLLTDLFVRQDWRSRGIVKQFMHRLAAIGKDEGCEMVMWTVWKKNEPAKRFYEHLGAVTIEDEQLMTWPI